MKVSVYIATSIDGYIARPNGDINWLMEADDSGGKEDYGYKELSDTVDCMVMGRNSMEMVMGFPEWPYEGKRVIVLSNTLKETPSQLKNKVDIYSGSLIKLVTELKNDGCKRIYVDGGKTIQSFINEDLITDITITKIPVTESAMTNAVLGAAIVSAVGNLPNWPTAITLMEMVETDVGKDEIQETLQLK